MGVGGQRHVPAALPLRITQCPLYRRLGGSQGRSEVGSEDHATPHPPPPTGILSPKYPKCSKSLLRLSYPGSLGGHLPYRILFKSNENAENGQNLTLAQRKHSCQDCDSLGNCLPTSHGALHRIALRSSRNVQNTYGNTHTTPHKIWLHVVYFHKTHTCSTNFCKELPCRI
jgi:hypothetical protein